jgi:hypothetical protein
MKRRRRVLASRGDTGLIGVRDRRRRDLSGFGVP